VAKDDSGGTHSPDNQDKRISPRSEREMIDDEELVNDDAEMETGTRDKTAVQARGVFEIMDLLLGKKRASDRRRWIEENGNLMEVE
jgi:hypothetical protein